MTPMSVVGQLGETDELDHTCNAFCRGERHAQLLYANNDDIDSARSLAREFCRQSGFRFVAVEKAHEAGPMPRDWATFSPELGGVVDHIPSAHQFAILLIYEEGAHL